MADLSVNYMGIALASPVIVSSSSLTGTLDGIKRCADAGAGAVVIKSLFEEQIDIEVERESAGSDYIHPEAEAYFRQMSKHLGPEHYLAMVEKAKKELRLPVIASLNCVTDKWWGNFAGQLEKSGADGLELNLSIMPRDSQMVGESIEKRYIDIVRKVKSEVTIPVAVKIGPYFSNLLRFCTELWSAGVSALVLFNRFYQMDIDIEKMKLAPGYQFSSPIEMHTVLRWVSILSGQIGCHIAAGTGVHDGKGVIKQLLAGAAAVQVCSALYIRGVESLTAMNDDIKVWMDGKGYKKVSDFQGRLSQAVSDNPEAYERIQYIKALTGVG